MFRRHTNAKQPEIGKHRCKDKHKESGIYIYIKKQRIVDLVSILMIGNWNWNITIATIVIIWLLKVTNKLYESHWEMKVTGNGNIYLYIFLIFYLF